VTAAIYARKSTDQSAVGDEAKSVTRQIAHAKAYAERKGWTVPEPASSSTMASAARNWRSGQACSGYGRR
jgi:DNA invertase Pin-like site-specific DNA recombinase